MTNPTAPLAGVIAPSPGWFGRLDPACIGISQFDPRHPDAMYGVAYSALKASIVETAGNLVPVLVRQVDGKSLELVYGRRRLQACLESGLPVVAVVQPLSPHEAFEAMVRVCAPAWSLYELGGALKRSLDAGLYPSMRRVAQPCGLGLTEASLAHTVATWPTGILRAFASPTAITPAVARAVQRALIRDPAGVEQRAQAVRGLPARKALVALREPKP